MRQAQGGYLTSLQWDWFISPEMFLETKTLLQKTYIEATSVPCTHDGDLGYNPCETTEHENEIDYSTPARLGRYNAFSRGNAPYFVFDDRWRMSIDSKFSLLQVEFGGTHDFKTGFTYAHTLRDYAVGYAGNLYFYDVNAVTYDPDTLSNWYWIETTGPFNTTAKADHLGIFIQDVYKPVDNVTIRYGTRYDQSKFRNDVGEVIINTGLWGPRFSAIWDPWGDQKTKVSGSIGRFNETGRLGVADYLSSASLGSKLYVGEFFGNFTSPAAQDYDYSPIANTNSVADELTQPRADIFSVGVEREIIRDLAAQLYFTGKYTRNLYAFDELNLIWDQDGYNVIGTTDGTLIDYYRMRTPIIARRDYYRVDFSVLKVNSDRWQMQGTYSYTISRGTTQAGPSGFMTVAPQVPYYYDGFLPTDIRHDVSFGASWDIPNDPWTTQLGMVVFYESGYPLSRSYSGGYQGGSSVFDHAALHPDRAWLVSTSASSRSSPSARALSGIKKQRTPSTSVGRFAGITFDNRWNLGRNNLAAHPRRRVRVLIMRNTHAITLCSLAAVLSTTLRWLDHAATSPVRFASPEHGRSGPGMPDGRVGAGWRHPADRPGLHRRLPVDPVRPRRLPPPRPRPHPGRELGGQHLPLRWHHRGPVRLGLLRREPLPGRHRSLPRLRRHAGLVHERAGDPAHQRAGRSGHLGYRGP